MIYGSIELTKKKLIDLAQILGAVEVKAGDRDLLKNGLRCVAYSRGVYGPNARLYVNDQGNFFVAKNRNASCYFGNQFLVFRTNKSPKWAMYEDFKMDKNFNKWDRKIKCNLPAWYVFDCCMKCVKDFVNDPEKLKQWEELLEFLIDCNYFRECDMSFEEVMEGLIKGDEIRFIGVDDLSKKGLEYYAKINEVEVTNIDLIDENGGYGCYYLNDYNYITTLKNNTIVIWNF